MIIKQQLKGGYETTYSILTIKKYVNY